MLLKVTIFVSIFYVIFIVFLCKHSKKKKHDLEYLKHKRDNLKLKIYFEEDNVKAIEELMWVEREIMNLEG